MHTNGNLATVRRLLGAIETGDADIMAACFVPDAVQIEHPNRLKPQGDRRRLEEMLRDFERGKALLKAQRYEVLGEMADGDRVALQIRWTGVLATAVGSLKAGDTMVAHSAVWCRMRDGVIVEQQNFDCFEAF